MRVVVCLKLVPATTTEVAVAAEGRELQFRNLEQVVGPYDEYALEAALRMRDRDGSVVVSALGVGAEEAVRCLRHAFSLRVDEGLWVAAGKIGARRAAEAAAAALKKTALPDLILCGRQSIDDDLGFFPAIVAEALGWPFLAGVAGLKSVGPEKLVCQRRFDDSEQTLEIGLPAVISCDRGPAEPRFPTLKGRLEAKKRPLEPLAIESLPLSAETGSPDLELRRYSPPPERRPGWRMPGDAPTAAGELFRLLRTETDLFR